MKLLQFNLNNNEVEQAIEQNYGLIVSSALKFNPKNKTDLEDYIQIGVVAFINGFKKFDPNRSKFSTYISSCIKNAIYDYLSKDNKHKVRTTKKTVEVIPSEQFWELIPDNLTSLEKSVIMLKLENYTKLEISLILDCTQKEVTDVFKSAKKKIRAANDET